MCLMCDPTDIKRFVTAGHAIFTLSSMKTGNRFTFKISEVEDVPGKFFVSLLNGPDNASNYVYMGMMKDCRFWITSKSKVGKYAQSTLALEFFLKQVMLMNKRPETVKMEFRHEGKCGRCGRKLTVPESIDLGLGPDCAEKMGL